MSLSSIEIEEMTPRGVSQALRLAWFAKTTPFIWGAPGISKSAIVQELADSLKVAFIDVRLSQIEPTDLRGIPFPTTEGGVEGVRWSAPLVMPRDLDHRGSSVAVGACCEVISFFNPTGNNGIRYYRKVDITVTSVSPGLEARIVGEIGEDSFIVCLVSPNDETASPQSGTINYRVVGKAEAVLALEEFSSALPTVQAASYQLVLDRRLGEYVVPRDVFMVALGNRDSDKSITYKLGKAISNRFAPHIEMTPSTEEWLSWAARSGISPQVIGYIMKFPDRLFVFNPSSAERAFPTPRSWEFTSRLVSAADENGIDEPTLRKSVIGTIGIGEGAAFVSFRKDLTVLPNPADILNKTITNIPTPRSDLCFFLMSSMCSQLLREGNAIIQSEGADYKTSAPFQKHLDRIDNYLDFCLQNMNEEIGVMSAHLLFRRFQVPCVMGRLKMLKVHGDKFLEIMSLK